MKIKIQTIFIAAAIVISGLAGCSKKDPILPGNRVSIFSGDEIIVAGKEITPSVLAKITAENSLVRDDNKKYVQTNDNVIWENGADGTRIKIFSGFPTDSHVSGTRTPVYSNGFIYAGLSTGEVVKIDAKSREMAWAADIFKPSNMTGGASMLDIVAPLLTEGGRYLYVGGLGGQFCKIKMSDGSKVWCDNISVGTPFVISGGFAFVVSTDNYLYAIDTTRGEIYWRAAVKKQAIPKIVKSGDKTFIRVDKEQFNAASGDNV